MVREAERHADEDKRKKELVEMRNQADSVIYNTEKSISEHRAKLSADVVAQVETEIRSLKEALEREQDPATLKALVDKVTAASMKIGEQVYRSGGAAGGAGAGAEGGGGFPGGAGPEQSSSGDESKADEKTVDAEFKTSDKKT